MQISSILPISFVTGFICSGNKAWVTRSEAKEVQDSHKKPDSPCALCAFSVPSEVKKITAF